MGCIQAYLVPNHDGRRGGDRLHHPLTVRHQCPWESLQKHRAAGERTSCASVLASPCRQARIGQFSYNSSTDNRCFAEK